MNRSSKLRNPRIFKLRRKKPNSVTTNPDLSTIIYRGPVAVPRERLAQDMVTMTFCNDFGLTSSAGGALIAVWNSDPTSAVDWAAAANLYTKYRVLAFRFNYAPNQTHAVIAATLYAPFFTVVDNGNNTNLAGYAAATSYSSCREHTLNQFWKREVKMDTFELAQFNLIGGSPASLMQIKTYCTGLTATTTYGQVIETYLVQFIGRQ
jgi:hypothetical protein